MKTNSVIGKVEGPESVSSTEGGNFEESSTLPLSVTAGSFPDLRTRGPRSSTLGRAMANPFQRLLTELPNPDGGSFGSYYSLPALNDPRIDELPISIRYLLESAIRNCDNFQVMEKDIEKILDWANTSQHQVEIPFKPARVILQVRTRLSRVVRPFSLNSVEFGDFTGVPAVVDLAAMRDAMKESGGDPNAINPQELSTLQPPAFLRFEKRNPRAGLNSVRPQVPVDLMIVLSVEVDYVGASNALSLLRHLQICPTRPSIPSPPQPPPCKCKPRPSPHSPHQVPVDLVIDHSVQVDYAGASNALSLNMEREFERNRERFAFLKWGSKAFSNMLVVPPGAGIVHQVRALAVFWGFVFLKWGSNAFSNMLVVPPGAGIVHQASALPVPGRGA
ncbi:unnamed protein product [Closterium sp. NIES-54]